MGTFDIVGYTYKADTYCFKCIPFIVNNPPQWKHMIETQFDAEDYLEASADILDIDRANEYSFDSDEFPKIILQINVEDEICGRCHEPL